MQKKHLWFALALVLSLALDQGTKIWARSSLRPRAPETIVVVPGYFELEYAENHSSAFGLLPTGQAARWGLFGFGVIALGAVGLWLRKVPAEKWRVAAELGLIAGGAVGNLIDRAVIGHVTDFVLWKVGAHRWPNFNIADAALVVGVAGLFFDWKPEPKPARAKAKA